MRTVLRLLGPLQVQALRSALDTMLARHESLRTRIVTSDGEAQQLIDAAGPAHLVQHELQGHTEAQALERAAP